MISFGKWHEERLLRENDTASGILQGFQAMGAGIKDAAQDLASRYADRVLSGQSTIEQLGLGPVQTAAVKAAIASKQQAANGSTQATPAAPGFRPGGQFSVSDYIKSKTQEPERYETTMSRDNKNLFVRDRSTGQVKTLPVGMPVPQMQAVVTHFLNTGQ